MSAVRSPLAEGVTVRIFMTPGSVSLQVGLPGEIWAMTRSDSNGAVAVAPSMDKSLSVAMSAFGDVVARGRNSIAYVQDADQAALAPRPNEDTPWTVIVPEGTRIEFHPSGVSSPARFLYNDKCEPTKVVIVAAP